jgi:predicted O-methyltransferase YrrM
MQADPSDADIDRSLADLRSYAVDTGWARSRVAEQSQTAAGEPIPWFTYPAIEFLARAVPSDIRLFEFGSGQSTLWWAARVAKVTSVEHDPDWAEAMRERVPENVDYHQIPLEDGPRYANAARYSPHRFSVIVIDGRERARCTRRSLPALAKNGVFVWDNADRPKYARVFADLEARGFKRLPFVGHGPITPRTWDTSIFYRTENCLGI